MLGDLEVIVQDNSHICHVHWSLFDDESIVVKVILNKLEQIIKHRMEDSSIPVHDHQVMAGGPVNTQAL